jgi:uncharacterized protein YjbI with pentapeptide repeats
VSLTRATWTSPPTTGLIAAQLQDAKFSGAQLQGAHLIAARLEGANLHSAKLEYVFADSRTRWPDRWDQTRLAVGTIG